MNNGTYLKRNIPYFRVRVETLIGTGSIKKKLTDEQVGAIDTQLASYNTTIVQIEEQYWPLLDKNWHLAVERGDYIVREEVGGYEGAMQLLAKFGKENVDWLMAGSALQSGRSAMVFLHRESAPEVLKMHDEIMRVQAAGLTLAADLAAQY